MLLLLFPTLPTGARMADLINGRTQLGCQCFLQSLRLELGAAPLPLFTELPRGGLLGNRERIFMRRRIKVPAPKVRDWGERALSTGPNA
jgi:hypothetical protein